MSTKRRQHSASFKSKVALASLRGDKTISELCKQFDVSSSRIHSWKKSAIEGLSSIFSSDKKVVKGISSEEADKLYAEIGKLKIERDFLEKKLDG